MKRENIKQRKRSFWAMLLAVLVVFNMMPLGVMAKTVTLAEVEYAPNGIRFDPGDFFVAISGDIPIDGGYGHYLCDEQVEIVDHSYFGLYVPGKGVWFRSIYNVTFDTNGGSANPAAQEVIWGEKANRPADPTKAGDTFAKWVKVKNGVETDFSFNTTITEDTKLKAKWSSELNSGDNHTHSYTWKISKEPTATSDGEEIYVCECGHIAQTNVLPGSAAFEADIIAKIKKAPVNGIVTIETRIWNSLSKNVRDALVERPDVTLKISFLSEGYKGIPLKVTIPTGIDRYALWDEKGWLGLCRAGSTLGYDKG